MNEYNYKDEMMRKKIINRIYEIDTDMIDYV